MHAVSGGALIFVVNGMEHFSLCIVIVDNGQKGLSKIGVCKTALINRHCPAPHRRPAGRALSQAITMDPDRSQLQPQPQRSGLRILLIVNRYINP